LNRLLRPAREEGFTLAELLIVVTIVAILVAIAVPTYIGFRNRAHDTANAANARSTSIEHAANEALENPASSAPSGGADAPAPSSTDGPATDAPGGTATTPARTVPTPDEVRIQPVRGRVRVRRPLTLPQHRPPPPRPPSSATRTG
jgi:type IV pilus assembly protein PilA